MIKEKSITVSRGVKVNLGNYQSTDFFVAMSADIDHDEEGNAMQSAANTYDELLRRVQAALRRQLSDAGHDPNEFI